MICGNLRWDTNSLANGQLISTCSLRRNSMQHSIIAVLQIEAETSLALAHGILFPIVGIPVCGKVTGQAGDWRVVNACTAPRTVELRHNPPKLL